jgi:HlyD family secretion protein
MWNILKKTLIFLFAPAILFALYEVYREKPVAVDFAFVTSGPMQVTITEEGPTRVRDIYEVSTPISGHLSRVDLDVGQYVTAYETVIGSVHPLDPPFLDERTRQELQSHIKGAEAAVNLASIRLKQAVKSLKLVELEFDRALQLVEKELIPPSKFQKVEGNLDLSRSEVESATAEISLREAELSSLKVKLQQPSTQSELMQGDDTCCLKIVAPVSGVILKVVTRSEQAVNAGAIIAEIGDPANLEIIVDLLSSDATKVKANTKVKITDWGGDKIINGFVRRVDPAAFTKVSALGIEEQRVNVIIDIPKTPDSLGHGFQLLAELVIWQSQDVRQVPISALFRDKGEWSVFKFENGAAQLVNVDLGQVNQRMAQVFQGLKVSDQVVLFPNDTINNGTTIISR